MYNAYGYAPEEGKDDDNGYTNPESGPQCLPFCQPPFYPPVPSYAYKNCGGTAGAGCSC